MKRYSRPLAVASQLAPRLKADFPSIRHVAFFVQITKAICFSLLDHKKKRAALCLLISLTLSKGLHIVGITLTRELGQSFQVFQLNLNWLLTTMNYEATLLILCQIHQSRSSWEIHLEGNVFQRAYQGGICK